MGRDGRRQRLRRVRVGRVEREVRQHRRGEVADVVRLLALAPLHIGGFLLRERFGAALGFEFGTEAGDGGRVGPDAEGEDAAAAALRLDAVRPRRLDPPRQRGIARRQQHPVCQWWFHAVILRTGRGRFCWAAATILTP
jgi:hypothetical protein